ncbi:hypothetical protein CEW92_09420, partial [Bacillaceae bacterium SAS-127]
GTTTEAASFESANNYTAKFFNQNVRYINLQVGQVDFLAADRYQFAYGAGVVSLSSSGKVTALKPGTAKIYAYGKHGMVTLIYTVR